jgi:hypothetical protein
MLDIDKYSVQKAAYFHLNTPLVVTLRFFQLVCSQHSIFSPKRTANSVSAAQGGEPFDLYANAWIRR